MSLIPIQIPSETIHVNADRRLAFQVLTAFNASMGADGPSNRVLEDQGTRKFVEFTTPISLGFGMHKNWITTEWVDLHEPEAIDFNLVPGSGPITGGLKLLSDRFELEDHGSCTQFTYHSKFAIRWSVFGWMLGKIYIQKFMQKHMREHLSEVKIMIEARAERSRVHPQAACTHDLATAA
jgi:hypothetical protein